MGIIKKCIVMCLSVALLLVSLNGCGKGNEAYTATEITDEIKAYNDSDIAWTKLNKEEISAYFGFSAENISDLSVYINDDDENYDIAAAFEFDSDDDMMSVIETLNKSLSAAADSFKNTSITESEKIGNRVVLKNRNILVVAVSTNHKKIGNMLQEKGFISVEK